MLYLMQWSPLLPRQHSHDVLSNGEQRKPPKVQATTNDTSITLFSFLSPCAITSRPFLNFFSLGTMEDIDVDRKYYRSLCAFNSFSHMLQLTNMPCRCIQSSRMEDFRQPEAFLYFQSFRLISGSLSGS